MNWPGAERSRAKQKDRFSPKRKRSKARTAELAPPRPSARRSASQKFDYFGGSSAPAGFASFFIIGFFIIGFFIAWCFFIT
jgi:hypothetical protein